MTAEPSSELGREVMRIWGARPDAGGLPAFEGVIESVGMKYTMFLPSGMPVRATCSVKFKEASRASFKKGGSGTTESGQSDSKKKSDCSPPQQ